MYTKPGQLQGAALVSSLHLWSKFVFGPAKALYEGEILHRKLHGEAPGPLPAARLERYYSYRPGPFLDDTLTLESVEGFEHMSQQYEFLVRDFSDQIWDEAQKTYFDTLPADRRSQLRILDPSAGPGREAIRLAKRVATDGEVVAADLSPRMVERACWNARAEGVTNMAFYQINAEHPPDDLLHKIVGGPAPAEETTFGFDLIYSSLAFHHYENATDIVRSFARMLRPGGQAVIVDGGPEWFKKLARPISKLADPGFVRHRTGEQFQKLFEHEFALRPDQPATLEGKPSKRFSIAWKPLLPGINLIVATKLLKPEAKQ